MSLHDPPPTSPSRHAAIDTLTSSTPHVILDRLADEHQVTLTPFAAAAAAVTMDNTSATPSETGTSLPTYSCSCCGGSRPKVVVILPPTLEVDCDRRRVAETVQRALANHKLTIKDMDLHFTWVIGLPPSSAQAECSVTDEDGSSAKEQHHVGTRSESLATCAAANDVDISVDINTVTVEANMVELEQGSADPVAVPLDQMQDPQVQAVSCRFEEHEPRVDAAPACNVEQLAATETESEASVVNAHGDLQQQAEAIPLPDSDDSEDERFDSGEDQLDDWNQVELVPSDSLKSASDPFSVFDESLAQESSTDNSDPSSKAPYDHPTDHVKADSPDSDKLAEGGQAPTLSDTLASSATLAPSHSPTPKLKLGTDLFQIIVDNMAPDATDGAIRALVPPDLKPARVVIPPARPMKVESPDDKNPPAMVRGAMFDFTSRMDAITFWNSARKSYAEHFLAHLALPGVTMTFWARPGIATLLEQEGLPRDYEYSQQSPVKRPRTLLRQIPDAPFTTTGTPPPRPFPSRRSVSVPAGAPLSIGFSKPPNRAARPPGIFVGSLKRDVTEDDIYPLIPEHLHPCQVQVHAPIRMKAEGLLFGRVTISTDDLGRAAALFKYFGTLNDDGGLNHLVSRGAKSVVVTCMPEVRRYTPPSPTNESSLAGSSRGGSAHEDDDADSAVVRNSPLIPNGRAARELRDEAVVAQGRASPTSAPRGSFVVHVGNLHAGVSLADIQALVPSAMSPTAMFVPRDAPSGDTGHVRVFFATEPEAVRFGDHLKALKAEKDESLVNLAAAGQQVTVILFTGPERRGSLVETSEPSKIWQPTKTQSPVLEKQPELGVNEDDQAESTTKTVTEAKSEPGPIAGGWDAVEVASTVTSWMDQPSASGLQDDFAGVQPPVQPARSRAQSVTSTVSGGSSSLARAAERPPMSSATRRSTTVAPAVSTGPKHAHVHVNNLRPDITLNEFVTSLPLDLPRPTVVKMIPARMVGSALTAAANLFFADPSEALTTFDRVQEMIRAGEFSKVSAPDARVTAAVLGTGKVRENQQQDAGYRGASQQRGPAVRQGGYDQRAQSVQSRRGGAGMQTQPIQQRGTYDVRSQSVQPVRGGGDRFDARAQSVQRRSGADFTPQTAAQRPSKWNQLRGSAAPVSSEASKYTKSGRLKVAEPIPETPSEPPKPAPYATPIICPSWAKAPPAALPTAGPSIAAPVAASSSSSSTGPSRSTGKTSFFTNTTTIKLHCVHLRHLSDEVTDNQLHYLIPNHWAGDQQPSAVEFKPATETEEGSGIFKRQAKYFFNESKDARAFVDFIREKDSKGKLARLKQDPTKQLVVTASHAPVCVPPTAIFLYPGQTF